MGLAGAHPAAGASSRKPLVVRGLDKRIRALVDGVVVADTRDAVLLCAAPAGSERSETGEAGRGLDILTSRGLRTRFRREVAASSSTA